MLYEKGDRFFAVKSKKKYTVLHCFKNEQYENNYIMIDEWDDLSIPIVATERGLLEHYRQLERKERPKEDKQIEHLKSQEKCLILQAKCSVRNEDVEKLKEEFKKTTGHSLFVIPVQYSNVKTMGTNPHTMTVDEVN